MTYILDAGPCLNFFATNTQNILVRVVGKGFMVPETVRAEVQRRSQDHRDRRFERAWNVWMKLEANDWLEVLSDAVTPDLVAAADAVLAGDFLEDRLRRPKDLGEAMVVIHAVAFAMQGDDVTVVIDDGDGRRLAATQGRRMERLSAIQVAKSASPYGRVTLMSTVGIIASAVRAGVISDKGQMKRAYEQLRACDDGLLPLAETDLLGPPVWP